MPALIAPSPITAMTLRFSPLKSRATAMPRPEEIEVELCAAPNGSYSLSDRLVKPDSPPQIGFGQPPQIGGHLDPIEKRRPIRDVAWLLIQDFLLTLGGLRRIAP